VEAGVRKVITRRAQATGLGFGLALAICGCASSLPSVTHVGIALAPHPPNCPITVREEAALAFMAHEGKDYEMAGIVTVAHAGDRRATDPALISQIQPLVCRLGGEVVFGNPDGSSMAYLVLHDTKLSPPMPPPIVF
jgi:hypothetical protein